MCIYDLVFYSLIAWILTVAKVLDTTSISRSSTKKYYFDDIADFDDIVEINNDGKHDREEAPLSKKSAPSSTEKNFNSISTSYTPKLLHIQASKKLQGIKNRQSRIFSPKKTLKRVPFLDESDTASVEPYRLIKENHMFEKPEVFVVKDHFPRRGYFMVKEKRTTSQNKPLDSAEKCDEEVEDQVEVSNPNDNEQKFEDKSQFKKLQGKFLEFAATIK